MGRAQLVCFFPHQHWLPISCWLYAYTALSLTPARVCPVLSVCLCVNGKSALATGGKLCVAAACVSQLPPNRKDKGEG